MSPGITPLRQMLTPADSIRARTLLALNTKGFLYAKVGTEDFFAFPEIVPGSIVRIDTLDASKLVSRVDHNPSKRIFLVERADALRCGHLRRIGRDRLALCSTSFPFKEAEVTLDRMARILGVVDAEIHPIGPQRPSNVPTSTRARPSIQGSLEATTKVGRLIQVSRIRAGLTFRQASAASAWVADMLGDEAYFTSPGTLSDYEHLSAPPRRIQKLVSLCVVYSMVFWDFLRAAGLSPDFIGNDSMPDELCGRDSPPPLRGLADRLEATSALGAEKSQFLSDLVRQWQEIPLFLRNALPEISGLQSFSLSDVFWVGAVRDPIHPHMVNASLVAVNRRTKKPVSCLPHTFEERPVYMILKREGGYVCGCCTVDRGTIAIHRHSLQPTPPMQIERHADAEIIGQVTAILRRLS